jgi:transcriptional regulator with XRE-family HTH domain
MRPRRRSSRALEPPVPGRDADRDRHVADDDRSEWRQWMHQLGDRIRRLRDLVGLSQDQLARLAGVSQGAVSRLETARGLATPLVVVLKINLALAGALRRIDPTILDADLRRALDLQEALGPAPRVPRPTAAPVTSDPRIETLIGLYRETPERHRDRLLAIMRAAVTGLKDIGDPDE